MNLVESEKLNFAVFIDFDNIEIGVKSTLNREFDVKCVLDGIKERGEIAAKIAYANWGRQQSEARKCSENGVQMVQRDTTPRGDKNGADINLALDALEMAFTRDHINAFAIISGDSDFMALVNKLKQYNKRVYIVGGKAFTSTILQRNCHEFISYESLLDQSAPRSRRGGGSSQRGRGTRSLPLSKAIPLIDRALSALDRRGVQPQLGLLKSTVLQLDSSFTERDYGGSSFSNFIQKLVAEGIFSLTTIDGHHVVERKSEVEGLEVEGLEVEAETGPEDAIALLGEVLQANLELLEMGIPAREVKALVKAVEPDFNETDYGFSEFTELLNFAQDKGVVRGETDSSASLLFHAGDELANLPKRSRKKAAAKPAAAADASSQDEEAEARPAPKRRPRTRRPRKSTSRSASARSSSSKPGDGDVAAVEGDSPSDAAADSDTPVASEAAPAGSAPADSAPESTKAAPETAAPGSDNSTAAAAVPANSGSEASSSSGSAERSDSPPTPGTPEEKPPERKRSRISASLARLRGRATSKPDPEPSE
jgi:uncharacterized protein (TIGR00288 family)